jgi:hypothetical protein
MEVLFVKDSIIKRYPNLTYDDIGLRDDGNGKTYIEFWNSNEYIPSMNEIMEWVNEDDFTAAKENKLNELEQACSNAILDGFTVMLNEIVYKFSYDLKSQSRFNGTGVLFLGGKITEVPWTAYQDGKRVRINLTKEDFDIVSLAALDHQNNNIIKYNLLLLDVDKAESIDDLNKITWS